MFRMAKMKTGSLKEEQQALAAAATTSAGGLSKDDLKLFQEPELGEEAWPQGRFMIPVCAQTFLGFVLSAAAHLQILLCLCSGLTFLSAHAKPGDFMDLMIEFRPPNEDIFVGRVVVETTTQSFSIELLGTGREAMLLPDVKRIEFNECLVGNTYSKEFSLLNSGEVKYPVRLYLVSEC